MPTELKLAIGAFVGFLLLGLVLALKPFTVIGAGERGVVMVWGKVQPYVFDEGFHWFMPISTRVENISVRVQKSDVSAKAASKDLQDVQMDVVVNWRIDPSKINAVYQSVGDEKAVLDNILAPAVNEIVKAATAQKTAEEIITKRPELKANIDTSLAERLATYGILLNDLSLVHVDFSKEFNAAIESKQVAEQQAQQAKFTADKAIQDAQAAINKAKGEAEAQQLQQQTLTPLLLQKLAIEKWSGVLPIYFGGNGPLPFLDIAK